MPYTIQLSGASLNHLSFDPLGHDTMPPAKSWTGILIPINVF